MQYKNINSQHSHSNDCIGSCNFYHFLVINDRISPYNAIETLRLCKLISQEMHKFLMHMHTYVHIYKHALMHSDKHILRLNGTLTVNLALITAVIIAFIAFTWI